MNEHTVIRLLRDIARGSESDFTGYITEVSDVFVVQDREGQDLIQDLSGCTPEPLPLPVDLVPEGITLCVFAETDAPGEVGAFKNGTCVGVYAGSCLYVVPDCRGQGIGPSLAIAAAVTREGSVIGDWEMHGYCEAGLAAHERAYQSIVDWSFERRRHLALESELSP